MIKGNRGILLLFRILTKMLFIDQFARGLKNVIDSFEKAREWADLSNCLQKVKKYFD